MHDLRSHSRCCILGASGYSLVAVRGESCSGLYSAEVTVETEEDLGVKAVKRRRREQTAPLLDISACRS